MEYTIVTAWYDVREKENHPLKDDANSSQYFCSMDWYFHSAEQLFNKAFPMVIFTEPRFRDKILEARPKELHSMTRFIFKDYDELPFYNHFKTYEQNHGNFLIQNVTKEKFTALYKFIVNQKTHFVKEAIEFDPFQTPKFAWMDMRLHCVYDMSVEETTKSMADIPPNQVKIMQMSVTDPVHDRHDFYAWTRGKVAAGFFGGDKEVVLRFCELCHKEWLEALRAGTAPTDEMIYAYVVSHNPHMFDVYVGEYSECLKNQVQIRAGLHLVFPFLQSVFDRGIHQYTIALSERIRRGYRAQELDLNAEQIHKVYYYGYVANFWKQQRDKCAVLLHEYFDLAQTNQSVADYIRGCRDFLNQMVAYMGDPVLTDRLMSI